MKIELNKQITKMKEVLNQELEFRLKQSKDRSSQLETQLVEAYESSKKEIQDSVSLLAHQKLEEFKQKMSDQRAKDHAFATKNIYDDIHKTLEQKFE